MTQFDPKQNAAPSETVEQAVLERRTAARTPTHIRSAGCVTDRDRLALERMNAVMQRLLVKG